MRLVLGLLLLVLIGAIAAVALLPWKVSLGLFVGLVLLAWFGVPKLLRRALVAPFKAKSAVLAGARMELHGVSAEEAPPEAEGSPEEESAADDEPPPEDDAPKRRFCVDLTISPQPSAGPFQLWEPGELRLVPADAPRDDPYADTASELPEIGEVGVIEVMLDGTWERDEGMKYAGEQRLRLHIAVKAEVERIKLRYYFEDFSAFSLPKAG